MEGEGWMVKREGGGGGVDGKEGGWRGRSGGRGVDGESGKGVDSTKQR